MDRDSALVLEAASALNEDERPSLIGGITLKQLDHQGEALYRLASPQGQEWQVRPFLYQVAIRLDGHHSEHDLVEEISAWRHSRIDVAQVRAAVKWLKDQGFVEGYAQEALLPAKHIRRLGQIYWPIVRGPKLAWLADGLAWMLHPSVAWFMIAALLTLRLVPYLRAFQGLFFFLSNPWGLVPGAEAAVLFGVTVFIGLFHELGHAAAARWAGLEVEELGVGLNYIYPIYFTRMNGVWAASRKQRFVIAGAGIYFQLVAGTSFWVIGFVTHHLPFMLLALFNDLVALSNLHPFLRFDGYWMIAHGTGILNLSRRGWGQVWQWITWGRRPDRFLSGYRPGQRIMIAAYGIANLAFVVFFTWSIIRVATYLFMNLPSQVQAMMADGLTVHHFGFLLQSCIFLFVAFTLIRFALSQWRMRRASAE